MAANKNPYQNAGDYTLDGVLIVGSSGEKINVASQVRELNIYQSIDSPYMSGNIMIADSEGVAELLPFLGQERLLFMLQTPSHGGTVDFNVYNEDHTLGNIIQSHMCLFYKIETNGVNFVGYTQPHPLENYIVLRIGLGKDTTIDKVKKIVIECTNKIITFSTAFLQEFNKKKTQ